MTHYVIEVKSGRDAVAEAALQDAGYLTYRPLVTTRTPHHRYKGRYVTHVNHLLPGYVFIEVPPAYLRQELDLNPVYQIGHVVAVLGEDEDRPCRIEDEAVNTLRDIAEMLSDGMTVEDFWKARDPIEPGVVSHSWQMGQEVVVLMGASRCVGVIAGERRSDRFPVELQMLGKLHRIRVSAEKLEAA